MIKVLHVVSDTNIGGAGKWLLNYLERADREKFYIEVAVPKGSMLTDEIKKRNTKVNIIPGMKDKSFDIHAVLYFIKIFLRNKYDIVHTHASLSARIAARLITNSKIVYSKHCMDNNASLGKLRVLINNCLCDKIVAVADACKDEMLSYGINEKKITVIHNGVKKIKFLQEDQKNKIKKKYGINKDDKVAGIFARLEPVKGHEIFIDAAEKIVKINPNVKFIVAGEGSLKDNLINIVNEKDLKDNFIFTGFVNDITDLINIIDVNVVSSYSEALSLSIIEAMSVGKPCVVTDTGGNCELIADGKNGFVVPVGNSRSLYKAILTLLEDDELRNKFGREAFKIMNESFSLEIMVSKLEKLYEAMLERRV